VRRQAAAVSTFRRPAMTTGGEKDRRAAVLRERARQIALPEAAVPVGVQLDVMVFQLAWENYAIDARFVREIVPLKNLTPIPCTPGFVLGLINLRGELCPVIDLKRLFGLPEQGLTNATTAVILHDAAMEFGIIADVIVGVQTMETGSIQPPPATLSGINATFLRGVTSDHTVVLDAESILSHPGIVVNQYVDG
jgi:purine-binding chemotaxis protein CheW